MDETRDTAAHEKAQGDSEEKSGVNVVITLQRLVWGECPHGVSGPDRLRCLDCHYTLVQQIRERGFESGDNVKDAMRCRAEIARIEKAELDRVQQLTNIVMSQLAEMDERLEAITRSQRTSTGEDAPDPQNVQQKGNDDAKS